MSGKTKNSIATFKGFVVIGTYESPQTGKDKSDNLSPPFMSRDAAETTLALIQQDPEMCSKYKKGFSIKEQGK